MPAVIVIGAGITGVTTAYNLARAGHTVTLLERHRYPAMDTSYANGGQLSASNAEVWNSWKTIAKAVKWLLQADAPLRLNPLPSVHKYSWLAEFVAAIRHREQNTQETVRLALRARTLLFKTAERERIDFDLEKRGLLHLYHTERDFRQAEAGHRLLTAAGLERYAVTGAEMRGLEPALTKSYYAGYFTPGDASGDIHKFTQGLAKACTRLGVRLQLACAVTDITFGSRPTVRIVSQDADARACTLEADAVVVCAGVESYRLARSIGERINVYPVKGYSLTVCLDDSASQAAAPTVALLDEAAKIVTSRLGRERFRIAGTAELAGYNLDIRARRIAPLVHWCTNSFPEVSTVRVTPWAGLRPMLPDMMPWVGRSKHAGLYYNTGHGHLGWTLSCATAEIVSELVDADLRLARAA